MNSAEKQTVLHCLKSMIDETACEECPLYGMTGTVHCEKDCVRLAINTLEQEPCTDAISRQAVLEIQEKYAEHIGATKFWQMRDDIKALQPVTPQPKMGRWIDIMVGDIPAQACDKCKAFYPLAYTGGGHKYCPNCGRKMQEVKE